MEALVCLTKGEILNRRERRSVRVAMCAFAGAGHPFGLTPHFGARAATSSTPLRTTREILTQVPSLLRSVIVLQQNLLNTSIMNIIETPQNHVGEATSPPIEDAVPALTEAVPEVDAPPPRRNRKPVAVAIGAAASSAQSPSHTGDAEILNGCLANSFHTPR